jgi:hypothetical protein
MPFPGSNADFQEPSSPDQTSAPSMPDQQQDAVIQRAQGIASGLAQALAKRKKAGLIGPRVKAPSTLTAAIARAKRAHQGGDKYG